MLNLYLHERQLLCNTIHLRQTELSEYNKPVTGGYGSESLELSGAGVTRGQDFYVWKLSLHSNTRGSVSPRVTIQCIREAQGVFTLGMTV